MKKIYILLMILAVVSGCSKNIRKAESSRVFMWKIIHQKATVYLLGSIHVGYKKLYPLDRRIEDAFNNSDYLVLEIDITNTSKILRATQMYAMYRDGTTLKDHIGEKLYDKFFGQMMQYSFTRSLIIKSYKPMFAGSVLTVFKMEDHGFYSKYGIDNYFQEKAVKKNMPVLELENAFDQMRLLGSFPDDFNKLYIKQCLHPGKEVIAGVKKMFHQWLRGDGDAMYREYYNSYKGQKMYKPLNDRLVDKRNIKMAEKIDTYLQTRKKYFVVAGSLHMVGPGGIVSLLRKKGYSVKQQ